MGSCSSSQWERFRPPVSSRGGGGTHPAGAGGGGLAGRSRWAPPPTPSTRTGASTTTAIMRRLLTLKETGVPLVLGIVDVDLFQPDSSFVYGEADREAHVAVMSLHRLKGRVESWKRRASWRWCTRPATRWGSPSARTPAARCTSPPPSPTPTAGSCTSATTAATSCSSGGRAPQDPAARALPPPAGTSVTRPRPEARKHCPRPRGGKGPVRRPLLRRGASAVVSRRG